MRKKLLVLAGVVAVGGASLVMAGSSAAYGRRTRLRQRPDVAAAVQPSPEIAAGPPATAFQRIAKAESPGVVNVSTSKVVKGERMPEGFQEFFRGFPGLRDRCLTGRSVPSWARGRGSSSTRTAGS